MDDGFVHLHTHSHYSLLDGAASPEALVQRAAALGMPALALTDHQAMFGVVRFYRAARAAGIHPIIGLELAVGAAGHHVTLLAENDTGYRNLCRLSTAAMAEGESNTGGTRSGGTRSGGPGRPVAQRRLWDDGDGLIVLSGCRRGHIPTLLSVGRFDEAKQVAAAFRERFGQDSFFIELQDHGLDGQRRLNEQLVRLAGELGLGLVGTNNVHYIHRTDAAAHDALVALGAGTNLADPRRPRFGVSEFYLKSAAEMQAIFGEWPEAVTNTVRIAERCRVELGVGRMRLPSMSGAVATNGARGAGPATVTSASGTGTDAATGARRAGAAAVLARRVDEGARRRFGQELTEAVTARLEHELAVIAEAGLSDYFLLVADIVQRVRELGIAVGPGRGSAASSLVAYCLHITDVDPITHELVFERFLNPDRMQMPDIDVDVCDVRREELLADIRERYGPERVAQIATFGTLAARAAMREVGRLLDVPGDTVDQIVRLIPNEPNITIAQAQVRTPALARVREADGQTGRWFELAEAVEGTPRHLSVHAAGIVIGDEPLASELPLVATSDGTYITQYPMDDVQALGFVKMDILGLRTLTVTDNTKKLVAAAGRSVPRSLPLEDDAVYEGINKYGTEGIFQLETPMFQRLVERLRPSHFSDIVVLLALGRPGPVERVDDFIRRRHGQAPVRYHHPALAPILEETYGVIVYQEQVMRIAVDLAGYSPGEADLFRRAMSTKQAHMLAAQRARFVDGATGNGIPVSVAERLFSELATFAGYGFAKSHSVAYALLSYETAYLRTHYPTHYFAALLSSWRNNYQRIVRYVTAARRLGVTVRPPDVNTSPAAFQVVADPAISRDVVAFGLEGIRHMGRAAAEAIVTAREDGPFVSFADFCRRIPGRHGHRKLFQSLIEAGACDAFGEGREQMLESVGRMPGTDGCGQPFVAAQTSLFGGGGRPHSARADGDRRRAAAATARGDAGDTEAFDTIDDDSVLIVEPANTTTTHFEALRRLLAAHPGPVPVLLRLTVDGGEVTIRVDDELSVAPSKPLMDKLHGGIARGRLTSASRGP